MKSFNKKSGLLIRFFHGCSFSRNNSCPKSREAGFTLIEVMIVVAIISILSALAFPSLSTLIPRNRTKAAARELRGYMQKAKLEAIKQNSDCLVVFTQASSSTAKGSCVICISSDDDCTDADDQIISQFDFNGYKSVELSSTNFTGGNFKFNSRGIPNKGGTSVIKNTAEAGYSFDVIVSPSGRVRIE